VRVYVCVLQLNSQLGVEGLLLHDLHDGPAGIGAALWGGVDRDGLLCCSRILLSVDVDPIEGRERD
jgi:hypothetical protein